jgi:hypothetical protein
MSTIAVPIEQSKVKRWIPWIGWAVSLWPAFVVGSSATWKLTHNAWYVREFARIGWPESALPLLACLQLGAMILFLIPPTSVIGCILLTGYLGGAIASYTRIGEPYPVLVPLSTSVIAWLGLWLREERLRQLTPWRMRPKP